MNILSVIPQKDYKLLVAFEDGRTGIFDIKPYLDSEVFAPLKSENEFERLFNGKYFIEWDCGADLSADTILAKLLPRTDG